MRNEPVYMAAEVRRSSPGVGLHNSVWVWCTKAPVRRKVGAWCTKVEHKVGVEHKRVACAMTWRELHTMEVAWHKRFQR